MTFINELLQKYPEYCHCFDWNNLNCCDELNIDTLLMYHKLNLPKSVSHKIHEGNPNWAWDIFSERLPWEQIKAHPELPWDWSGECEIGGVSNNASIPWEDIYDSVTNKDSELHCYSSKWDWMWLTVHKNVTWEIIQETKDITDPETGEKLFKWCFDQIVFNTNIPMSVFMEESLKEDSIIPCESYQHLIDIDDRRVTMAEFEWHYNKMEEWGYPHTYGGLEPFRCVIDLTYDFIKRYPNLVSKYCMRWLVRSEAIPLEEIVNTDGITLCDGSFRKWNYSLILNRKDVDSDFIRKNIRNPKFGWTKDPPKITSKKVTLDIILDNIDLPWRIDHLYCCLEHNPNVTWNDLQKIDPYSFSCIQKTFTKEYCEKNNFKWEWDVSEYIQKNPNVTWQWILDNEQRLGITLEQKRMFAGNLNITWDVVLNNPEIFEDKDTMWYLSSTCMWQYAKK